MFDWKRILPALAGAALALSGCGTVRDARQAQRDAAAKGEETRIDAARVDLSGYSLDRLVGFALATSPSMRLAELAVEDARLALREIAADAPIASMTPWNAAHASLSAGYSESSVPAHLEDMKAKTERGNATSGLSLDLLLWDFGRNNARARAQAENVLAAEESLVQEGYAVFVEVSAAYLALMQNEALHEVAASNVQQYVEHLSRAEDRFNTGEAQNLDVLKARLDLARARESLVAASNDVTVAGARLMAAIGVDASKGDFRSVLGRRESGLQHVTRFFADSEDTSARVFELARTNAPAMKIARARLRAASAQVDYAIEDLMPTLTASVSLNWTDPLWVWRWGLGAAQTVFTGGRKTTAVDRAVVAMQSAGSTVDSEEQALSRKVEIAVAERDNARESMISATESVRQAAENLETVKSQYEVGDVSRVEFTDAVSAYTEALGNKVKAFYRAQAAEAALFELTGREPVYAEGDRLEEMR